MRDETDQRYKIGKKMFRSTGLWGRKGQESYQTVIQGCWRADLIQGRKDLWEKWVNGHQVCEQQRISSITSLIADINIVEQTINHDKCNYKLINT